MNNDSPSTHGPKLGYDQLAGQRLGKFILDDYIGRGKIGFVYRAHRTDIPDIEMAIKIVPSLRKGWETEIKKVAKLRNIPNVVQFHDVSTDLIQVGPSNTNVQYTVWDYIPPGKNLKALLEGPIDIPASFCMAIVETILRVLHACETRGIPRHGDLHAGNILIGEEDETNLDANLQPVAPVFVSDFGYGATSGGPAPKDDYKGLAAILNALISRLDWAGANSNDRQVVEGLKSILRKTLSESTESERTAPKVILQALATFKSRARSMQDSTPSPSVAAPQAAFSVGSYQVSEMLGDNWSLWKSLFVAGLPARSQILDRDITSVVTGPRGCGKTMVFRRLSERLIVECGPVGGASNNFVGIYVNANDISDCFSRFPDDPEASQIAKLHCFTHLCILSDLLAIESALSRRPDNQPSAALVTLIYSWLGRPNNAVPIIAEENYLERLRTQLEQLKTAFIADAEVNDFPAQGDFATHTWLKRALPKIRSACSWVGERPFLIFLDDYTIPRVSRSMQRELNRIIFQRSPEFVFKIATEAATTFLSEDSNGKALQVGDDYRLVDLGEEALFMSDAERVSFLNDVLGRRLSSDQRIHVVGRTLRALLGSSGCSKTDFARRLRSTEDAEDVEPGALRGSTKRRALYFGHDVFCSLWSGDTRILIQVMQDLVGTGSDSGNGALERIGPEEQDRVFRNSGSHWLNMQTRNQPSEPQLLKKLMDRPETTVTFVGGSYGFHLKAVVEAFKDAARLELMGPVYVITENGRSREVPKMAFRIEITDEFRLGDIATEIYRDLIRYGIFMRDARGKSIRGAMVPRLYLKRLLLPYCALALSKRDSVSMTCKWFSTLLLSPDTFMRSWRPHRRGARRYDPNQEELQFDRKMGELKQPLFDRAYDDTLGEQDPVGGDDDDIVS